MFVHDPWWYVLHMNRTQQGPTYPARVQRASASSDLKLTCFAATSMVWITEMFSQNLGQLGGLSINRHRNSSKVEQLEELEVSIGLNATTATIIKIGMVWSIQERWRSALPAQSIPKQSGIALIHLETTKTWTLRRTGPSHKIIIIIINNMIQWFNDNNK